MAGDVVESANARFEAFGALHDGVARLVEARIPVFGVAGNHDVEVLPRLARSIPGYRLLGAGGTWEMVAIGRGGDPWAHVAGWSFPAPQVRVNPIRLPDFPRTAPSDLPLFGVLHCDLDGGTSPYAPVPRVDLERSDYRGWFLGHIHRPSVLDPRRPLGYLGSLVGIDPSETGPRGPWLLAQDERGELDLCHVPLAPLRWEEIDIDTGELSTADALLDAIARGIEALHRRLEHDPPRAVGCRVRLTGKTGIHRELRRLLEQESPEKVRLRHGSVLYFVAGFRDESRPELDLRCLSRGDHPAGLLARRLLVLEQGGDDAREMIGRVRRELEQELHGRPWAPLGSEELDDEKIRTLLLDAGSRALEELLFQNEASAPRVERR